MRRIGMIAFLALMLAVTGVSPGSGAQADADASEVGAFRILVFSKTAAFRHASIPDGIAAIQQLGEAHNFLVDATEDSAAFTDENLRNYKAVVWLSTTGSVLNGDQQAAFQRYIQAGGGFVGIHAASDTHFDWPWYGGLVGAYFQVHPAIQEATVRVDDRAHPSTVYLPDRWVRTDEWYNFQSNPRGDVHVLATLDESTYDAGSGAMGLDHPIAWCHDYDGGRSWYTAMGHTSESFTEPAFLAHLLGGIESGAGVVPADCGATRWANFQKVALDTTTLDPMKLKVAPDGRVFYIERRGEFRVWKPDTQSVVKTAVPTFSGLENGILGVELDPDFETNNWVYLYYSPQGTGPCPPTERAGATCGEVRVSRFALDGDTLDLGSEIVLLAVAHQRNECCHSAGDLTFDREGNLYVSTGDDTNPFASSGYTPIDERPDRNAWDAQRSSANTNDLRGKVLRITPQPDGTYTIPEGNLFPPGTAQTRPEIYAMGFRNPFTVKIDPATGALLVADYGPDAGNANPNRGPDGRVELNHVTSAGNYGWPYCVSDNVPYNDYDFATNNSGPKFDCDAPVNDSPNNTGLRELPPARPSFIWQGKSSNSVPRIGNGGAPMTGPLYRHDAAVAAESDVALPAYYDNTWFFLEWNRNQLYELKLDADGGLKTINRFLQSFTTLRPMYMEQGPDGALYLIEWGSGFGGPNTNSGVYRIDYLNQLGEIVNRAPVAVGTATPDNGALPLTVQFSAAGTYDPDFDIITYAWDLTGDGVVDSTEPDPVYTYAEAGDYPARLTVTDVHGLTAVASVPVSAGNTRPEVTVHTPVDGGFFDWGDTVAFDVSVLDPEDGEVDCDRVTVQPQLGHDEHAHPLAQLRGCQGEIVTMADGGHGTDANLFYVLDVFYTDLGAPGVSPLTGRDSIILQPKTKQAEHFDAAQGVTVEDDGGAESGRHVTGIGPGDWIAFTPVSLNNIDSVTYRVGSPLVGLGGSIELRVGAPDGPLVSTATVNPRVAALGFTEVTAEVDDPGGTNTLYVVFRARLGLTSNEFDNRMFTLDQVRFNGQGVSG